MIVCDTHALVFDALAPKLLGSEAARVIEKSHRTGDLACADISLWKIAMLMDAYFGFKAALEKLFGREVDLVERAAVRNPYFQEELSETQVPVYAA